MGHRGLPPLLVTSLPEESLTQRIPALLLERGPAERRFRADRDLWGPIVDDEQLIYVTTMWGPGVPCEPWTPSPWPRKASPFVLPGCDATAGATVGALTGWKTHDLHHTNKFLAELCQFPLLDREPLEDRTRVLTPATSPLTRNCRTGTLVVPTWSQTALLLSNPADPSFVGGLTEGAWSPSRNGRLPQKRYGAGWLSFLGLSRKLLTCRLLG